MILFKTIEMNLKAVAAECSLVLKEFVKKIGMYGRRYANILAKVLDSTGDSYAVEIIKEFSIFDTYRVKLFKHRIENHGVQYVLENTHADFEKDLLEFDPSSRFK